MTASAVDAVHSARQPHIRRPGWGMVPKLLAGLYLTASVLTWSSAQACGWWGDGESDLDDEAVVVTPGQTDTIGIQDAGVASAESMTRQANKLRLYGQPGYAGAVRLYRSAAQTGYAPAQNNLGAMYEDGLGVAANLSEAARWYLLAAEQGEPRAQHSLGMLLLAGQGVEQNNREGLRWIERAAEQNHPAACADLGRLYMTGQYTKTDFAKADYWLRKAEQLGYPSAGEDLKTLSSLREKP